MTDSVTGELSATSFDKKLAFTPWKPILCLRVQLQNGSVQYLPLQLYLTKLKRFFNIYCIVDHTRRVVYHYNNYATYLETASKFHLGNFQISSCARISNSKKQGWPLDSAGQFIIQ